MIDGISDKIKFYKFHFPLLLTDMSPCHFKICNMGRKRNAGSYVPY